IKENFKVFSTTGMETYESITGIPTDFLLSFNASTLKSTLFWWLENDMPYTAAEMAEMYTKVSFFTNFQILRAGKDMELQKAESNDPGKASKQEAQNQDKAQSDTKENAPKKENKKASKKKDANKSEELEQEEPSPESEAPESDQ
ncbi:MAG TPA: TetR-like C-terminal domain-containing protein, partial [Anaerolineaceae bacterium]|nr:TetR-like C-terminal domain-containing protein [Anaerolineaceae bacterium]